MGRRTGESGARGREIFVKGAFIAATKWSVFSPFVSRSSSPGARRSSARIGRPRSCEIDFKPSDVSRQLFFSRTPLLFPRAIIDSPLSVRFPRFLPPRALFGPWKRTPTDRGGFKSFLTSFSIYDFSTLLSTGNGRNWTEGFLEK